MQSLSNTAQGRAVRAIAFLLARAAENHLAHTAHPQQRSWACLTMATTNSRLTLSVSAPAP
jgi:hypothetical protein